jgi:transcriptional regulator with XRE-family HTH domain
LSVNSNSSTLWQKFARSKSYREEFVAAQVKQGLRFQIRAMMKQRQLSQEELAARSGVDQSTISRAIDLEYGKLNLTTLIKIAAGFDVAFIGRFVPFSELEEWLCNFRGKTLEVLPFEEEDQKVRASEARAQPCVRGLSQNRSGAERIGSLPRKPMLNETGNNVYVMPPRQELAGEMPHRKQVIGGR